MNNVIDEKTTKSELLEDYRKYPVTGGENLLEDKPWYESRILPLFYETPVGSKVLDLGCNDGTFMQMLKDKRKCEVFGIDISETALEEAKKKGLNVFYADAHKIPFGNGIFDVVVMSEVISHVQNPDEVLVEIKRVLKKNGVLLGSAPHANLQRYAWEDKQKIRQYYETHELTEVLRKSFDKCYVKVLNGAEFAMSLKSTYLGNLPSEMLFKAGGKSIIGWDAALQDRSVLRCWMGFTQGPGVVYYRMSGFADKMQEMGAEVHYDPYNEANPVSTGEWTHKIVYQPDQKRFTNQHIVRELESLLKASDMSVFQVAPTRSILLLLTTARLGAIKKPLIMELDDWIFDLPSYNLASGAFKPNSEPEAIAYDQIKLSDAFIVSTQYLQDKLEPLVNGKPIYVVKNSLDFNIWDKIEIRRPAHEANPNLIRIGYSGCQNHSGDLEIILRPIQVLLDEFPNLEFISLPQTSLESIKSDRFKLINTWVPLSIYPQCLSDWELDIGIAPLRDNHLNRAKSNLRWLEYSALKIPTLASNIYPFKHSLINGKDGILVGSSQKEWYDAMKALIVDQGKRTAIGQKAYEKVHKEYDMNDEARKYLSILKEIKSDFIRSSSRNRQAS